MKDKIQINRLNEEQLYFDFDKKIKINNIENKKFLYDKINELIDKYSKIGFLVDVINNPLLLKEIWIFYNHKKDKLYREEIDYEVILKSKEEDERIDAKKLYAYLLREEGPLEYVQNLKNYINGKIKEILITKIKGKGKC